MLRRCDKKLVADEHQAGDDGQRDLAGVSDGCYSLHMCRMGCICLKRREACQAGIYRQRLHAISMRRREMAASNAARREHPPPGGGGSAIQPRQREAGQAN